MSDCPYCAPDELCAICLDTQDTRREDVGARLAGHDGLCAVSLNGGVGECNCDEEEDVGASRPVCVKCGMPVQRDWSGWSHKLPPMSARDARKYRHVVRVAS